ncbi:hypothetical protein [Pseudoalteromonas carrageenovora]|uniref:hypothetical protein n=1 Tax=Pseudoalteromonas carrageenovora TaxID=227 RepID=UPI0026E1283B|nr:hypothetical protein [Pseudoalteromonas carrageenovora]MDO6549203.1 hypothetical protein [Pseudoalteromonas carrageenovora]MDO6833765.1 hypothetical protein [Pseudoalteromonas carrageenovora]
MRIFIRKNYLFLLAILATIASIIWLILFPDFEPIVTSILAFITSVSLRPKDWMLIKKRSLGEDLPEHFYAKAKAGFIYNNVTSLNEGSNQLKFGWGESSLVHQDKSLEFEVPKPDFSMSKSRKMVKVRVVMSTLHNTYGEGRHFIYVYIPDKTPVCFYQFDGICSEMTVIDIDNDDYPELIIGYKCGAHTEAVKIFKLDKQLNYYFLEGSNIASDYPLITWGKEPDGSFFINSYSRNWETDREKFHAIYEKYIVENSQLTLKSSSKVKWETC